MAETARKRKRSSKRTVVIDGDLRRLIRNEAKQFGISEEEYLRLVVHVSETLRTSVIPAGLFDGGMLKTLLTNPMMLEMMKGMIANVISKWGKSDSSSGNQTAPVQAQPQAPAPGPWGGPPAMRQPWEGPGTGMAPHGGMYAMPGHGMQPPRPMWGGPPQPQPQAQPQQEGSASPFSLDGLSKMMQQLMGQN